MSQKAEGYQGKVQPQMPMEEAERINWPDTTVIGNLICHCLWVRQEIPVTRDSRRIWEPVALISTHWLHERNRAPLSEAAQVLRKRNTIDACFTRSQRAYDFDVRDAAADNYLAPLQHNLSANSSNFHILTEVCKARCIDFLTCALNLRVGYDDVRDAALSYQGSLASISQVVQSTEKSGNAQQTFDDTINMDHGMRIGRLSFDNERSHSRRKRGRASAQWVGATRLRSSSAC